MADTRRLRIAGYSTGDHADDIDRITKNVNQELSKVIVERATGRDVTPTSPNLITGVGEPFYVRFIMSNVTIVDSGGDELAVNADGSINTVERVRSWSVSSQVFTSTGTSSPPTGAIYMVAYMTAYTAPPSSISLGGNLVKTAGSVGEIFTGMLPAAPVGITISSGGNSITVVYWSYT
jgi:hypothetical protein